MTYQCNPLYKSIKQILQMGKRGTLQIVILKIGDINLGDYAPTKKNHLTPLKEIISDFEGYVDVSINGKCDLGCLDFDTNYGYEKYYAIHFDVWIKKFDLTVSIFHSYGNDNDHGDRTELYYLGKYASKYTLENIHNVVIDDIIAHTLTKANVDIILKMQSKMHSKMVKLLKKQCVDT
jgi:hypothetical protein